MTDRRGARQTTAIALIVIVVVIAGALALAATYNKPHPTPYTSTRSTVSTCTVIYGTAPLGYFLYCGSPLRISAIHESWNFTVSISSNSVAHGESILLMANLTNEGPNQTIKEFVKPYINPVVFDANGKQVWSWNPPQSTWPDVTVSNGEVISQSVSIPTSQFLIGQSYSITVAPLSIQFPTPNNMTFTFQFSVR